MRPALRSSRTKTGVNRSKVYNNERSLFILLLFVSLLGLGRPTAFALLPFRLQLPKVFSASLGDLPPAFPSKTDGGGVFLSRQPGESLRLAPWVLCITGGGVERWAQQRKQLACALWLIEKCA